MKTKIVYCIALGIVSGASFAFSNAKEHVPAVDDLLMENIEALSQNETTAPVTECPPPTQKECHRILSGNTIHIFYQKN